MKRNRAVRTSAITTIIHELGTRLLPVVIAAMTALTMTHTDTATAGARPSANTGHMEAPCITRLISIGGRHAIHRDPYHHYRLAMGQYDGGITL